MTLIRTNDEPEENEANYRLKLSLRRFFSQLRVEVAIGVLVLVSVLLTVFEFSLESHFSAGASSVATIFGDLTPFHVRAMELVNTVITIIFVVELSLRCYAAKSKKQFFSEFWLDIIATVPVFRVFRSARALRLLRLIRLIRLLGVISRVSSHYPYILRRGAADFLMICSLLLLAVAFGTVAITHFERRDVEPLMNVAAGAAGLESPDGQAPGVGEHVPTAVPIANAVPFANAVPLANAERDNFDLANSFWFSVYTLFAGEPVPQTPRTLSGKIVTVCLMFMGLTIFAIFAGTVSAFMVDRLRVEGRIVEFDELQDHIVICGWTPKTEIIIQEYRAGKETRKSPIVVITELPVDQLEGIAKDLPNVMFVHDDFTKVTALKRAGVESAQTCLVLSDTSGSRSEQDADARTILAALTVEKMNESVYTCAELFNRSYATHLQLGKVNDYVVSGEYGAHLLAQAAMKRGLMSVFSELLTYQRGNEFFRVPIPDSWIGTSFDDKLSDVRQTQSIILVAVHTPGEEPHINPEAYLFREKDEVVVIARKLPHLV